MVKMFKVESSNVVSVGWEKECLFVEYKTGLYRYNEVPEKVFLDLLGSKSRGSFLNMYVKNVYTFTRLKSLY